MPCCRSATPWAGSDQSAALPLPMSSMKIDGARLVTMCSGVCHCRKGCQMADLLELAGPGGKSETCGVTGLIGLYFRGIDASQAAVCWGKQMASIHMIPIGPITTLNRSILLTERGMSGTGGDDYNSTYRNESNESILRSPNDRLDNF